MPILIFTLIVQLAFGPLFFYSDSAHGQSSPPKPAVSQVTPPKKAASEPEPAASIPKPEAKPEAKKDGFGEISKDDPWSNGDGCANFWGAKDAEKVCVPDNSSVGGQKSGADSSSPSSNDAWGAWDPASNGASTGTTGTGGDVWSNSGVSSDGGWGNGGVGGQWDNNSGFMGGYNVTPSWIYSMLSATGVLVENYYQYIYNLRRASSFQKKDEDLAQEIIKQGIEDAKTGAYANAATTVILTRILPLITAQYDKLGGGIGMGMGMLAYAGFDYVYSVVPRARMVLRLAALYRQLPANPNERASLVNTMVIHDLSIATGTVGSQILLEKYFTKLLNAETAAATSLAAGALAGGLEARSAVAGATALAETLKTPAAINNATAAIVQPLGAANAAQAQGRVRQYLEVFRKGMGKVGTYIAEENREIFAGLVAGALVGFLSYNFANYFTERLGKKTNVMLKVKKREAIAAAKVAIENSPNYEKQVIWLLVLKSAFAGYPARATESAKRALDKERAKFLFALAAKYPLVKTDMMDEKESILAEYERDVQMRKGNGGKTIPLIDNALLNIAVHQPENVRLQIFKTVMEAMYVGKQTLTSDDQKALETLSIELAINLPVSLLNKMTPGDLRREIVATYDAVKSNIAERHSHLYNAMRGKAVLPDQEKAIKNIKMWGPAGTLFLEDLSGITEEENAERSKSKNGFTAATVKANGVLAKKQAEEVCAETGACGNSAASSVPLAASGSRK